jgi:hypothetical protein
MVMTLRWLQIELAEQEKYLYAQEVGPNWLLDFVTTLNQPKYFMNNIIDTSNDNSPDPRDLLYDNLFPAFFFGPAGSQSPLHTDGMWSFCSAMLRIHTILNVLKMSRLF